MTAVSALLVFCFFTTSAAISENKLCFHARIDDRIMEGYEDKTFKHDSVTECIKMCNCDHYCAVSFNIRTKRCLIKILNKLPIEWTKNCFMRSTDDQEWLSFTHSAIVPLIERPSGLWTLDSLCWGWNLGTKNNKLDIDTRFEWKHPEDGLPTGHDEVGLALLDGSHRAVINVMNGEEDVLLDFTKPFTIALWVKADNDYDWMSIFLGKGSSHSSKAAHHPALSFTSWRKTHTDHLELQSDRKYETAFAGKNRQHWRHFGVVWRKEKKVKFYVNGVESSQSRPPSKRYPEPIQPEFIQIASTAGSKGTPFNGSMTCIAVYERALCGDEMRFVMNMCPFL